MIWNPQGFQIPLATKPVRSPFPALSHRLWAAEAMGQLRQKALRISQKGVPTDVNITLAPPQGAVSTAQPDGWSVSVTFAASPDTVVFDRVLSSEDEAVKVYDDIVKMTAEVEGLLRQEKMEEAQAATDRLLTKYKANSSNPPADTEE